MTFERPAQPPSPPSSAASRIGRPRGRGRALFPTLLILAGLLIAFALFVGFYTDWLWYSEAGYASVFTKQLWTRIILFILFFLIAAAAIVSNGYLAYRHRPVFRAISLEQQSLDRYRLAVDPFRRLVLIALGAVVGFFFGVAALSEWRTVLAWMNSTSFGSEDPQFGIDISFYVFSLPWWRFLVDSAMVLVVLAGLVTAAVHYLYGGIRPQARGERTTSAARVQLSVLIGIFVLLKAASYWLDRYELVLARNRLFTGAGYTDINAVLPAKTILAGVALISAALFFINTFRGTWRLAVLSLGLMVLSALAIGGIYPQIVQRVQVSPSEDVKESPFIARNIEATRQAFGLDQVDVSEYLAAPSPDNRDAQTAKGTIDNVRLMDPSRLSPTFDQLQQVKGFYTFQEPLDVDRYDINGQQEGVIVAPREIDLDGVPTDQRNWINDHLTYTHGYGLVAAYGNRATETGSPDFAEFDLPPQGDLNIEQPRIYFGEQTPEYSIVGASPETPPRELDYPDDSAANGQRSYTYTGDGGVPMGSLFKQLVFAWKFQETNILLSGSINDASQIIYVRDPRERVQRVAPWLTLDADPYATVVDGRVVWVVDGYTTSESYPYAQQQFFGEATTDSLTSQTGATIAPVRDQINYLRNSVKATVDAYDGTVTLYAWDEEDPILQTWSKVFPGTVQPKSDIGPELMQHLRYPEDMFKVQREVYSRYHVDDPAVFYTSQDAWEVPVDPTVESVTGVAQPPYYLTLQLPGSVEPHFSLTTTFAPANRATLASFIAVNSDATSPDFGNIRAFTLPRNTTIPGPSQMQNNIESDPQVAQALLALRKGNAEVELGNLLTLPVAGGLMYVEPVYVRANQGASYPTLQKVVVSFGSDIAFADTYEEALSVFFDNIGTPPNKGGGGNNNGGNGAGNHNGGGNPNAQDQLTKALEDASAAYADGQAALADGDFAAYGEAQDALAAALDRAEAAAAQLGVRVPTDPVDPGATVSPSPSPSTSPSPSGSPSESTSVNPASWTARSARFHSSADPS